MRVLFLAALALVASVYFALEVYPEFEFTPAAVVVEKPKQLHNVIYIYVCGNPEAVFVTTDPMRFADRVDDPLDEELLTLMLEAEANGRVFTFRHWGPGCPHYKAQPAI